MPLEGNGRGYTLRLAAAAAVAVAVLASSMARWPGLFRAGWWHLMNPQSVTWQEVTCRLPLSWYVAEADENLVLSRAPSDGHMIVFSHYQTPLSSDPAADTSSRHAKLLDHLRTDLGLEAAPVVLGGLPALRVPLGDRNDGQIREQWIVPQMNYALLYARENGSGNVFSEIGDCIEFHFPSREDAL